MTRRTERVGTVIQRTLSEFILRQLSDPRLGFFTLSTVNTTPDLSQAKIGVSVMGTEEEKTATIAALTEYAPRMRKHLSGILQTRIVPKLIFELDRNLDHGFRIDKLLLDIERGDKPADEDGDEKN
ncbi:MAG: ribosome-binding factor [Fibrobacteria bacterium]|jgi:ribosome-binding factor A|nr:ribosome-binding factor [Fibrobacteria bacterium]